MLNATYILSLDKESSMLMSTVNLSKYRQHLKDKYKALSLSSPDEVLECKSSEYVNLYLTKLEENSNERKENLLSG